VGVVVVVILVVMVAVVVGVRTGLGGGFSAAGLAGVAAALLVVSELDPVVAREEAQLASQGHRLGEVREEGVSHIDLRLAQVSRDVNREGSLAR
jgi:hypothetical protein